MTSAVTLILPDILLISLGFFLRAFLKDGVFHDGFWRSTEKLVFYVLFPPLLFSSVASSHLSISEASQYLSVAIATMMMALLFSYLIRYLVKADDVSHASAFQCGFRFNSYIGFALVSRLYGNEGLALLSLLIAFWVPISNTIAVAALATAVAKSDGQSGSSKTYTRTLKAVVKNPLIIATSAGLLVNLLGVSLPSVPMQVCQSLGKASLVMGLLCIGAGIRLNSFQSNGTLIFANTVERLILVPALAFLMCWLFELPLAAQGALMVFAMLPTAQSCFVMTASMGGNAPLVANVTTAHTIAAIVTIPIWLSFLI